jgi:hypothetical protein
MVDVVSLDKLTIFISGDNVAEIECCNLIQRAGLSACQRSSGAASAATEAAKRHGAQVLERAKRTVSEKYPEHTTFTVAGQVREDEGQTFAAIFMTAYSLLLHQLGRSKLLRQGADKTVAALHLEANQDAGPSKTSKRGPSRGASTCADLPVML